jgi:phosphatidylglycerophosphate synthase
MENSAFRTAERAQRSVLAKVEKRCLLWLAERMPRWVTADGLTLLGFLASLAAGVCYWRSRDYPAALLLVIVCLAVHWFGDSLDGTLARVRDQQRPRYGFYVDHVVDTFAALFLLGGLALSGYISLAIAAAMLLGFYMLSIESYLAAYTIGTFHISHAGVGPTELRSLLSLGNLWLYFQPGVPSVQLFGQTYKFLDVGGTIGAAGMLAMVTVAAVRHTRALYRAEPLDRAQT